MRAIVGQPGLVPDYHHKGMHRHLLWSLALWIDCCLLVTCLSYSSVPKEISILRNCACALRPFLTTLILRAILNLLLFVTTVACLTSYFMSINLGFLIVNRSKIHKDLMVVVVFRDALGIQNYLFIKSVKICWCYLVRSASVEVWLLFSRWLYWAGLLFCDWQILVARYSLTFQMTKIICNFNYSVSDRSSRSEVRWVWAQSGYLCIKLFSSSI